MEGPLYKVSTTIVRTRRNVWLLHVCVLDAESLGIFSGHSSETDSLTFGTRSGKSRVTVYVYKKAHRQ